jgi:hypothetical protein
MREKGNEMFKKILTVLMATLMVASAGVVSAFAVDDGSYTATFDSWPASHGVLFPGPAVVTNADGVSTVTIPINTSFTIHGVSGNILDVILLSGSPYTSAYLDTSVSPANLVVTCSDSVTAADFAPELEFVIDYGSHQSNTDGTLTIS